MIRKMAVTLVVTLSCSFSASARVVSPGPLDLYVVKVKPKGGWTEVQVAIENERDDDLKIQCCTLYLENEDGYAVASLTSDDIQGQIYNKAKTAATVGTIIGAGLGLAGMISGHKELGYAAIGVAGSSVIGGVVGGASADKSRRNLLIDDVMRNQTFPAGLKVAGIAYFPPKKKWPGSQKAKAVHLTYKFGGKSLKAAAPVQ